MLLDDATTAIDPEIEHEVLEAMSGATVGRTTLIVANRLATHAVQTPSSSYTTEKSSSAGHMTA